jgi:hypothetical protein
VAGVRPEAIWVFGRNPQTAESPRRVGEGFDRTGRRALSRKQARHFGAAIAPRDAGLVAQPEETPAFGQFLGKRRLHSNLEQHASSEMRFKPLPKPQGRAGLIGAAR